MKLIFYFHILNFFTLIHDRNKFSQDILISKKIQLSQNIKDLILDFETKFNRALSDEALNNAHDKKLFRGIPSSLILASVSGKS